jgi:signal transduction histidine kinase/CheY-like chemotaxis protein
MRYHAIAVLAAVTVAVLALGWIVARDLRQSADDTNQLYDRFAEGLGLIDDVLFETEEVRRILLYALHTLDANRQLEYVDQSRAAEANVRRLLESRSALLANPRTRSGLQKVADAWKQYVVVRDEVIGLILEGRLTEGVALDEQQGAARFDAVRGAIGELKMSFGADAARQVAEQRARASRAVTRLSLMVMSTLLAAAIGIHLFNRRAALEGLLRSEARAKDAAEEAARVKSDFLATMSHELRTPLTGVVGIADLLQGRDLAAPQRELVRMLRSSAMTLLSLVNDILDYSRIEAGLMALAPVRFSLQSVIEEALDPVTELAARKGLDIGYVIEPGVLDVVADEDRVRQVLINLLSNAVKFTETGEVAVGVRARRDDGETVRVTVDVRDTGIGIPAHSQHQLFQRFSQLDTGRQVGGAGLGLAISERLSRLLGGSMTVESREGYGSTFTFVFTARNAPALPADAEMPDTLRGLRVLAFLRAGIVGDQIQSLLRGWGVRLALPGGEPATPPFGGEVDAILVDASAWEGTHYASVVTNRARWGLADVPMITVMRLRSADDLNGPLPDQVIATPVRAQALYDALATATGSAFRASAIDTAAPVQPPFEAESLTILLVEDNDANRRVVYLMLAELGLEADEAASGLEAVERARHRHYDVILMDVQMPDIDGLEATRRIRAEQRDTPSIILALTANVMESDEARCREAGMNGYLSKPLRLNALETALGSLVPTRS